MPTTTLPPAPHRPFEAGELRRHLDMYVVCETSLVLGHAVFRDALLDLAEKGALAQALAALLNPGQQDSVALAHVLKGEAACMGLSSLSRAAASMEQCLLNVDRRASASLLHDLHESLWAAWCNSHELLHALGFLPEPDQFQRQRGFDQQLPLYPLRLIGNVAPTLPEPGGTASITLVQVAYISEKLPDYPINLLDLLDNCAKNNPPCGLTGMLLVSDTHYFQLLEGPHDEVHHALNKIRRDPRHTGMRIVSDMAVDTRSVPEWSMAICQVKVGEGQFALNNALLNSPGTCMEKMVLPGHARDLLQGFCEGVTLVV